MNQRDTFLNRVFMHAVIMESGCWEFMGTRDYKGYGRIRDNGRKVFVHRRFYEISSNTQVPSGLSVCHTCDNRACFNPSHLFVGSHLDNMRDMQNKGRRAPFHGEYNGLAKMTNISVTSMRNEYATGAYTQAQLAEKYGISRATANKILRNLMWRHV